MADAAIPHDGKRQSTGEDGKRQSSGEEQVAKKLKSGESDEERANEAIRKLQLVYRKEEEDANVFRRLVVEFKKEYFLDKFVWNKIVKYMIDNLPTFIVMDKDNRTDEQRLFHAYLTAGGHKSFRPQVFPWDDSEESSSPPRWADEDEDEDLSDSEDDAGAGAGARALADVDEIEEIEGEYI